MIHLIRYFLRKGSPHFTLIMGLFMVVGNLIYSQLSGHGDILGRRGSAAQMLLMMALMQGAVAVVKLREGEEFDLALPFRRRTVFVAESLATIMLLALSAAPIGAVVVARAYLHGRQAETMLFCANLFLGATAIILAISVILRFVKRMPALWLIVMIAVFGAQLCVGLLMYAQLGGTPGLLQGVLLLAAGVVVWFVGMRQFDRYELVPSSAGGTSYLAGASASGPAGVQTAEGLPTPQTASPHAGTMDRFSPFVRVMGRAVWFRWWYLLLVIFMAGLTCLLIGAPTFFWLFFYPVFWLPRVLNEVSRSLLPFVRRRTILRCVWGPIAVPALIVTGVVAIVTDSPDRIVAGLAFVLALVLAGWSALPSAKEQARAIVINRAQKVLWLVMLSIVLTVIPGFAGGFERLYARLTTEIAPGFFGNPLLLSSALVLAIVFFWWRSEKKFMHYEPSVMPRGLYMGSTG